MAKVTKERTEAEVADLEKQRSDRFRAETLFKSASDARRRYDWEWLTRDLFRRGYHFSRYNPNNRTVIISTRSKVQIPINVVAAQMRTIKNQVTSIRPKWEVLPRGISDDSQKNARYSGKLLDYYYDHFNLRHIIKESVIQGLMYSVGGPWQIGYDPFGGEDHSGEVFVWLIDPFDFYIDPSAKYINSAEYVIKAVRTSLNEVKANPEYTFHTDPSQIRGESRLAASEYKQFLLQALKYYQPRSMVEEDEGVILKEAWIKVHVSEKNLDEVAEQLRKSDGDAEDLKVGDVCMKVITYIDSVDIPLYYKIIRQDYFPFSLYQADVNPMEIYGESWIKHVIPMNRVLDSLESSVFKYNYKYAIGRIVIDKNSGVRIISNEHGDIVEKNPGAEVTSLPLQALPGTYDGQIGNMRSYLEDVGGAHEVSMGRIPAGVKSGIGIAELKAADAVNQQDLVDALEEFLCDVGNKILRVISENYDVPKVIKALGKGGNPDYFTVIGENAIGNRKNRKDVKIGTDVFDLAVIGKDNEVRVTVGTWLAYTKGARLEQLKDYYVSGLIDQKTFLEYAEFADVQAIVDRTRQEKLLQQFIGTPATGAAGQQVSDEEIAQQENFMMEVEGRPDVEPQQTDNHQVHVIIHTERMGASANPVIEEHIRKHVAMARANKPSLLLANQPIQPAGPTNPPSPQPTLQAPVIGYAPQVGAAPAEAAPPAAPAPAPGSPEEAALMQSLMEFQGGR